MTLLGLTEDGVLTEAGTTVSVSDFPVRSILEGSLRTETPRLGVATAVLQGSSRLHRLPADSKSLFQSDLRSRNSSKLSESTQKIVFFGRETAGQVFQRSAAAAQLMPPKSCTGLLEIRQCEFPPSIWISTLWVSKVSRCGIEGSGP